MDKFRFPKIVMITHADIKKSYGDKENSYENDLPIQDNYKQHLGYINELFVKFGPPTHILYSPYLATAQTSSLIKNCYDTKYTNKFPETNLFICSALSRRYPPKMCDILNSESFLNTIHEETLKNGAIIKSESYYETDDRIKNLFDNIKEDFDENCVIYMVTHKFIVVRSKLILGFKEKTEYSNFNGLDGICVDYNDTEQFRTFNFEKKYRKRR